MSGGHLTEDTFIELIRRRFGRLAPAAPRGIGDDAAVLPPRGGASLISTDCLIESQHFRRGEPPFLLGRKALSVNVSDIAAMGGDATGFLLTLGIPRDLPGRYLDLILMGLKAAAAQHGISLLGGDTSRSPGGLFISITVLGRMTGARPLTRADARPGDGIYVSGGLGDSAAGRLLLETGWRARMDRAGLRLMGAVAPAGLRARARRAGLPALTLRTRARRAILTHLDPSPRTDLGRLLRVKRIASAAMDLSDGLSLDLARLCRASKVGARLLSAAIPIADAARALGPLLARDPLELAMNGGEDYELLFTVPAARERLCGELSVFFIGRITSRASGLTIADPRGRLSRLAPSGFDHFRPAGGTR